MEMIPVPTTGRVFSGQRRVRLGDISASGRVRLDAIARYLQDVSNDDTRDSGLTDPWDWLVRRTQIVVGRWPLLDETVTLQTFCSGTGARWAERRVHLRGSRGAVVDAATIWVSIDRASGRPRALSASFEEIFSTTAGGRRVSARVDNPEITADAVALPWTVRSADLDVLDHVNNAVYWAGVEEILHTRPDPDAAVTATLGFITAIERRHRVEIVHDAERFWFRNTDGTVHASGRC
jgi:acyl-ACP thioesterase